MSMVLKYLAVAALAAGTTYGMLSQPISDTAPSTARAICRFSDHEGNPLDITHGPVGPRLGDLDYIALNLSHEEKVRVLGSDAFDTVGMLETMAKDFVRNHDRVILDVYRSIERAIKEGF